MAGLATRRARDPAATREAILEASGHLLAKDGPEGISLSQVAHLAGVNRGTAYQHFETRENLIQATTDWVADKLFRAAFGDPATIGERRVEEVDTQDLTDRISQFAMQNPELCRVWLMQLLARPDPLADAFWREYQGSLARFAQTSMAVPNVDSEAMSVLTLAGIFLWPVWARAKGGDEAEQAVQARRIANECLRLSMYGSMRPDCFPDVAARLQQLTTVTDAEPAVGAQS
jgi:AcrR family transcriptional regulator